MQRYVLDIVFLLLSGCICGVITLKVYEINSSQNLGVGSDIKLICHYDPEGEVLHDIKWYRNKEKIFQYMLKRHPPHQVFAADGFQINTDESNEKHITLKNVGLEASGVYTCKVTMEDETFSTASLHLEMNVLNDKADDQLTKTTNCIQDNEHFSPYKSYHFNYVITAIGKASGTTAKNIGINIKCDGIINAKGGCQYSLQVPKCTLGEMSNVTLKENTEWDIQTSKSEKLTQEISRYPVAFSMVNGEITELLAHRYEPLNMLNMKRGIITTILSKSKPKPSEFEEPEMRTDIQGTCPVRYENHGSAVSLVKDLNKCHFPERVDWPYSPLSLFWNMSFIQMFWINSTANCTYKFSYAGNLQETLCDERHAILLESTKDTEISVQTNIRHKLDIQKTTVAQAMDYDKNAYIMKSIQYEYEKSATPKENPQSLTTKVLNLLEKLSPNDEEPINSEHVHMFDELINILRESSNLSEISTSFHKCKKDSTTTCQNGYKYDEREIKSAQIWRDALIQCNRASCMRAFRKLLESEAENLDAVIGTAYLDFIFYSWTNAQVHDIQIIEELFSILKSRNSTRLQVFALSSITNSFWTKHKGEFDEVPETLKKIVDFIAKPINTGCATSKSHDVEEIILALQAITTMGGLYEKINPDCLDKLRNCIVNREVHWSISVPAIEATQHMLASDNLYYFLLNILQNPDLKHEDHVRAYLILAKKFGNTKFVKEVTKLVTASEETGLNYNLKTFIVSHMRAVIKAKDPVRIRFAKAIQEALPNFKEIFKAATAPKPVTQNCNESPKQQEHPYTIPEDDDFELNTDYFSKYTEADYSYGLPFLRDSVNRLGYGYSKSTLYKGTSHVPYAFFADSILYLFGKKIPAASISANTRYLAEIIQESGSEIKGSVIGKILQIFNANKYKSFQNASDDKASMQLRKLPYEVDEKILESLISLENRQSHTSDSNQKKDIGGLLSLEFLGDALTFRTFSDFQKDKNAGSSPHAVRKTASYNSNYWKVVEAFNLIPTLIGLPLNWTTDAYSFHNGKHNNAGQYTNLTTSNSFNALAAIKNGMNLGLPMFTNIGIQSFSTVSTSIGANVDLQWDVDQKLLKVGLELPQRPMQLLSLTRRNSLIKNGHEEEIADWDVDRVTENWCSDKVIPIIGMKLCHNKSYPDVTNRDDKPWTLMAGNSHWKYTTEFVQRAPLQFAFYIDQNEKGKFNTFSIDITSTTMKQVKPIQLVKLVHRQNITTGEFQTKLSSIFAQLKASKTKQDESGYHFKVEYGTPNGAITIVDYLTKVAVQQITEDPVRDNATKIFASKLLSESLLLNITTSENFYGFTYKHRESQGISYTDHVFKYKSLNLNKRPWLRELIEHEIFWEDSHSGWVELHREVHNTAGVISSQTESSLVSYNYLRIPKSIIQLHTYNGPSPTSVNTLHFNLTKHQMPNYNLMTFINISATTEFKDTVELQSTIHQIKFTDPWNAITIDLASRQLLGPPNNYNISLSIKRKAVPYPDILPPYFTIDENLEWLCSAIEKNTLYPTTSLVELNIEIKDHEISQMKSYIGTTPWYSNVFSPLKKDIFARFAYYKIQNDNPTFQIVFGTELNLQPYESRYGRHFSLEIPTIDFRWNSTLMLDFTFENEIVLWKSNMSHISAAPIANYIFNVSISKPEKLIYLSDDLHSAIYNRTVRLISNYPAQPTNFDLDMNITASSPISLLNVDLRQQIGERKEVMNFTHQLLDIDVSGNWQDGYRKTFNFKSKNKEIVPNMEFRIDYPDDEKGTSLQLHFPDASTIFYIICRKNKQSNLLLFTVCKNEKCTSKNPDSTYFVADIELSLTNPQKLTRTVIYNPKLMKLMGKLIAQRVNKMMKAFMIMISTPEHSNAAKLFLQAKNSIGSTSVAVTNEIKDFFYYFGCVVTMDKRILSPATSIAIKTWRYYVETIMKDSYTVWFWNYFNIKAKILPWTAEIAERTIEEYFYRPGPIHGKSYVTTISLPFYWTSFAKFPSQLSPPIIRQLISLSNRITKHRSAALQLFKDDNYNRHALLNENGIFYTFDGKISKDLSWIVNEDCAYLLARDFIEHKFVVYYQKGIHILFPTISVGIDYSGQVTVNERSIDLPFEDNNREITILREGSVIKLTTKFNFKLILSLNNDYRYFIFYTNKHKHNKLTGMLGNNNDNPTDDIKDPLHWELSGNSACKSGNPTNQHNCQHNNCSMGSTPAVEWWKLMWRADSPTLPCHDIVSLTESAYQYSRCDAIPNNLLKSYLGFCAAKGLPVGSLSTFIGECHWRRTWNTKINHELEVIVIMDQTQRSSQNILKGVETLVYTIHKYFIDEGYERVQFGLVGFKGKGYQYKPHQYTMNGELLASANVFAVNGIRNLKLNGPKDNNGTAVISALQYAADHYTLSDKSIHMFIMVTLQDEETISVSLIHETLQKIFKQSGTLYTIANYQAAATSKRIYGIRGDGYVFPQPKTKDELFIDFPKGQLAKLSSATRGAVWQLSYMDDVDIPPKRFVQSFAEEIVAKAKQDGRLCRKCHCHLNSKEQLLNYCEPQICKDPQ